MNLAHLLLNLTGLLLWVGWRAQGFAAPARAAPVSLAGLLQATGPVHRGRWSGLLALLGLLAVRAWFYWRLGGPVHWVPSLDLGVIVLPFNSVSGLRMLLFSVISFVRLLVVFYLWLLLLSMVNRGAPASDALQRLVRLHLGWVERWPWGLKLAVPWVTVACLWYLANPLLVALGMVAQPQSAAHLWQQGLVLGVGTVVAWKYLIGGVLFVHVLNSYLYLGSSGVWTYTHATARRLLLPLRWLPLRLGQFDFTPVAGMALVFLAAELGTAGLNVLFARLPL